MANSIITRRMLAFAHRLMTMSQPRLLRSRQQEKAVAAGKRVETANSLQASDFFEKYYPLEARTAIDDICSSHKLPLTAICSSANEISSTRALDQCFKLIESTSATDYKNSKIKWSPPRKKKEMVLPDMKYVILQASQVSSTDSSSSDLVAGFISFMITYEDSHEVVYIYEIHFAPEWKHLGLGKVLMSIAENMGRRVGVRKSMLTVFQANTYAVEWYHKLGYVEDEFSPQPRKLRNGTVREPSYVILSKPL